MPARARARPAGASSQRSAERFSRWDIPPPPRPRRVSPVVRPGFAARDASPEGATAAAAPLCLAGQSRSGGGRAERPFRLFSIFFSDLTLLAMEFRTPGVSIPEQRERRRRPGNQLLLLSVWRGRAGAEGESGGRRERADREAGEHKGRKDRLSYPQQGNSWYHLSKIHDATLRQEGHSSCCSSLSGGAEPERR